MKKECAACGVVYNTYQKTSRFCSKACFLKAMPRLELTGQRFGKLLVTESAGTNGRNSLWLCRCDCGATKIIPGVQLKNGYHTSCGYTHRAELNKSKITHGKYGTPTYKVWAGIKRRCFNQNDRSYLRYGARGITMCDRWAESFENFLADMGERPDGLSIDRIDNNGNYEPGNCRWATRTEQSRNKRNSRIVTIHGETKPLYDWAEQHGIKPHTLGFRIRNLGMTPEQAVAYRTGSKDDTRKNPRKIGDEVIAQLVRLRGSMPVKELATLFGLGESTIHAILKRERDLAGKDGGNAQNV